MTITMICFTKSEASTLNKLKEVFGKAYKESIRYSRNRIESVGECNQSSVDVIVVICCGTGSEAVGTNRPPRVPISLISLLRPRTLIVLTFSFD